jgi:hypothetical protein
LASKLATISHSWHSSRSEFLPVVSSSGSEEDDSYDESECDVSTENLAGGHWHNNKQHSSGLLTYTDEDDDSYDEEHDKDMDEVPEDVIAQFQASIAAESSSSDNASDPYSEVSLHQQIVELCAFIDGAIARASPQHCDKLRNRLKNKWRPVHESNMMHEKMKVLGVSSPTEVLELALKISATLNKCNVAFADSLPKDMEFVLAHS